MTYRGTLKNGVVVFEDSEAPAEGTEVRVEPIADSGACGIYKRLDELAGRARDLPRDLARRHDHYLHGRAHA